MSPMVMKGVMRTVAGAAAFSLDSPVDALLAEPAVAVAATATAELAFSKAVLQLVQVSLCMRTLGIRARTYVESVEPDTTLAAPLKSQASEALFWLL